jgi:hypothetical protein
VFELLELGVEVAVLVDAVVELDVDEVVFKLTDGSIKGCCATGPVSDVIVVLDMLFEMTLFGFVGLIGLIGLTGLFIFVAVITHVFDVTDHDVHVGKPYGSEHAEVLNSVINPLYPG